MQEKWKRDVALYIGSQTVSMFGSMLVQYAITWYIILKSQSGAMMTLTIVCAMLPAFFISPFAGVWADRYDRKRLIICADLMIAFFTLVVAVLFLSGYKEYWVLYVVLVLRAIGGGVQSPAASAYLPSIVPMEKLMSVNGTFSTIQSLITLFSPMASAALLSFASIEVIFFIDVATAAIAVGILLLFLKTPAHERSAGQVDSTYLRDLKAGFRYISGHPYLKQFFIFLAAFNFLCSPVAFLTPLQVTRSFGADVWWLTSIEVAFSVGMIVGGLMMGSWGGLKNRVHSMVGASMFMGIFIIALGLIPWFVPYLVAMGLLGLLMPVFNIPALVILQEHVEDEFRGRVFSVLTMISTVVMPVGMIVFGPLADKMPIENLLIGTGIALVLVAFLLGRNGNLVKAGIPLVVSKQEGPGQVH
ncbi:MAG: MFS transporter [Sphaerochaetaceae bacterium]